MKQNNETFIEVQVKKKKKANDKIILKVKVLFISHSI